MRANLKERFVNLSACLIAVVVAAAQIQAQPRACGYSPTDIEVSAGGKSYAKILYKVGSVHHVTARSEGSNTPEAQRRFLDLVFANFDLPVPPVASKRVAPSMDGQVRVEIRLAAAILSLRGFPELDPCGTGPGVAVRPQAVRFNAFLNGLSVSADFDMFSSAQAAKADITITLITDDAIYGRIRASQGDLYMRGTFHAALPTTKK